MNEEDYKEALKIINACAYYDMGQFDSLCEVTFSYTIGNEVRQCKHYGWIGKYWADSVAFVNCDGTGQNVGIGQIVQISSLKIDESLISHFERRVKDFRYENYEFDRSFDRNYMVAAWLAKKGKHSWARRILLAFDQFFNAEIIKEDLGTIYYDAMLHAFSLSRNYNKAATLGAHLSKTCFNGYEYQLTAMALKEQLRRNPNDFKTFHLPGKAERDSLKNSLGRKGWIKFLLDRIRLLNCIQDGQPSGISYKMHQFSVPINRAVSRHFNYWQYDDEYFVINPYTSLVNMHLDFFELQWILPYLLDETYIPSYDYFRDFFPERRLHKVSWVAYDLIVDITGQQFVTPDNFWSMSFDERKKLVLDIRRWCMIKAQQDVGNPQKGLWHVFLYLGLIWILIKLVKCNRP